MIADEVALGVTYDEIDDYLKERPFHQMRNKRLKIGGTKHSINGICQYQSLTTSGNKSFYSVIVLVHRI